MGKEIVVIDPDELEKQLVEKPAKPGDTVQNLAVDETGTDPDEMIATTRTPWGEK